MRINVSHRQDVSGDNDISVEVEDFYSGDFIVLERIFEMLGIHDYRQDQNKRPDGPANASNEVSTPSFDEMYQKIMAEGDYEDMLTARRKAKEKGEEFSSREFYRKLNEKLEKESAQRNFGYLKDFPHNKKEKRKKMMEVKLPFLCVECGKTLYGQIILSSDGFPYCSKCHNKKWKGKVRKAEKLWKEEVDTRTSILQHKEFPGMGKLMSDVNKFKIHCDYCGKLIKPGTLFQHDGGKNYCGECEGAEDRDDLPDVLEEKEDEFAIRCYLNGERLKTHELTKEQARNFHHASIHLASYLEEEYNIGKEKWQKENDEDLLENLRKNCANLEIEIGKLANFILDNFDNELEFGKENAVECATRLLKDNPKYKKEEVVCSSCNKVIEEQGYLRVSEAEVYCRNCEKERDEQLTRIAEKIAGDDDSVIEKVLEEVDRRKEEKDPSFDLEMKEAVFPTHGFVFDSKGNKIKVNMDGSAPCPKNCYRGKVHTGMGAPDCHMCGGQGKISMEHFNKLKKDEEALLKFRDEQKDKIPRPPNPPRGDGHDVA